MDGPGVDLGEARPGDAVTARNLHVLIVTEADLAVLKVAHATHRESIQAWREFVIDAAQPETVFDDELRNLYSDDPDERLVDIEKIIGDLSNVDLIDWWTGRDAGNAARFYEVQDKR